MPKLTAGLLTFLVVAATGDARASCPVLMSTAAQSALAPPAEVPASRLSVKAVANGKLQDVSVLVKNAKTGEDVGGGRTYVDPSTNPRIIPLPAGVYDVAVKAVGLEGAIDRELRGVEIGEGQTVERTVDFSSGELAVEVTRNGELSDATVTVVVVGTSEQVAGGRTYKSADTNPRVLRLTAGTYDIIIGSVEMAGSQKLTLPAVEVKPGERVDLVHEFKTGSLSVAVHRGGELADAVVAVRNPATKQQVAAARTYENEKTNPRTFTLPAGEYRIEISGIRGGRHETTATVIEGETVERRVDLDQTP